MDKKEIFVAQSLVDFFKNSHSNVSYKVGENPPDIYLQFQSKEIPVEISTLDENTLNNRTTLAMGYFALVKEINKQVSGIRSEGLRIIVSIYHGKTKAGRIKKQLIKFIYEIINSKETITNRYETKIKDVVCKATKYKNDSGRIKVGAILSPLDKSGKKKIDPFEFHIVGRLASIIAERVKTKEVKCRNINSPKWLALYDNYINKFTDMNSFEHTDTYKEAMVLLKGSVEFEKIFIVFENGQVLEIQ